MKPMAIYHVQFDCDRAIRMRVTTLAHSTRRREKGVRPGFYSKMS
jgi:hypothetical protein